MPNTIQFTPGLNRDGQEEFFRDAVTYQGMAHVAGGGPGGTTCRECTFWQARGNYRKSKGSWGVKPEPADSPCALFKRYAMRRGVPVPHHARSCKYFELAENPQPIARVLKSWE